MEQEFWVCESLGLAQEISREDYRRWQFLHQLRHREGMYTVHQQLLGNKINVYTTPDWENVPLGIRGYKNEVDTKGYIDKEINGLTIMVVKEGTWKIEGKI